MDIKVEELEAHGFELLEELKHSDLIPFVQRELAAPSFWGRFYGAFTILGLAFLVCLIPFGSLSWHQGLYRIGAGMGFSFLLIPLHEGLHGLAYRWVGARRVSYDAHWKKFYFMAIADRFVANAPEFRKVALAPFLLISISAGLGAVWAPVSWAYSLAGLVVAHASMCSGDFALLAYFERRSDRELLTWDDRENKISYFYGR